MPTLKLVAVLALALAIGQVILVNAQAPQSTVDGELVKEVRLIRMFLESTQKEADRREILLERYRLQHNSVTALTDRLDNVRGEAVALETELATASAKMLELQATVVVDGTDNAEHKVQLDSQLKDIQTTMQALQTSQARLSDQERRLASTLAAEDAKLRTLDSALEALVAPPR